MAGRTDFFSLFQRCFSFSSNFRLSYILLDKQKSQAPNETAEIQCRKKRKHETCCKECHCKCSLLSGFFVCVCVFAKDLFWQYRFLLYRDCHYSIWTLKLATRWFIACKNRDCFALGPWHLWNDERKPIERALWLAFYIACDNRYIFNGYQIARNLIKIQAQYIAFVFHLNIMLREQIHAHHHQANDEEKTKWKKKKNHFIRITGRNNLATLRQSIKVSADKPRVVAWLNSPLQTPPEWHRTKKKTFFFLHSNESEFKHCASHWAKSVHQKNVCISYEWLAFCLYIFFICAAIFHSAHGE